MRLATAILSGVMVVLGVTMISLAIARGGGPLAFGVIMGVLFVAAGVMRLWAENR
jgi:hypothetical protein